MRRLIPALAALTLAVAASTADAAPGDGAKRPITHEDLWLAKRVGAPAPSPDGRWVVFPVTDPAYNPDEVVSDLWIVPADGGAPPRRLTNSKAAESAVAWSPDGARIAFTAKREGDEVAQVYLLEIAAGGEARRVTTQSTGARSPLFSPDGSRILFTSDVYPGAQNDADNRRIAAERKARKYNARVYTGFPIRNWDKWRDDRRPTLLVVSAEGGDATDLLAGTKLAAEPGFSAGGTNSGDDFGATFTPDGSGIVFAASVNRHKAAYAFTNRNLYTMPAAGGEPRALTQGEDDWGSPAFSPDGRTLVAALERRTPKVYNATRLVALSWPEAKLKTRLTESLDRSVGAFAFAADGRDVLFLAEDSGLVRLYAVPVAGGAVREALRLEAGAYSNLAIADSSPLVVATWESAVSPAEVVRIDLAAGKHAALSTFNAAKLAELDLQPVRHFTFTSKRGKQIHSMLVLPPGFDEKKKYPLFVLIHGGPHIMWGDQFSLRWNFHLIAQPGYVVLLTNYSGSTGFGEKFSQAIQGDPLAGPADEINAAADEAIRRNAFIDGGRQCAGGASYGGHLSNWLQASTTRYRCLVSHAGLVNLEAQWGTSDTIYGREVNMGGPHWKRPAVWAKQNPIKYADRFQTPTLVTGGENDFRVPLNNQLEYWSALQRMQVESRLVIYPDENHWVLKGENSRFFYGELQQWLGRWLKP
ncbi:MAG: S9 family peptidase [Steroidobacteraceae bacterium]|nr:S9 family peptidase [Steroidobacteraceae bacterium]